MADCEECGDHTSMPYECRYCGGEYCSTHRLPENHSCDGLSAYKESARSGLATHNKPKKSSNGGVSSGIKYRLAKMNLPSVIRGNATFAILAAMVITFLAQNILEQSGMVSLSNDLFVLRSDQLLYVWTWVTSIFAHGNLQHLIFNGIFLFFLGMAAERMVGTKRYLLVFFGAAIVAGLSQVIVSALSQGFPLGATGLSRSAIIDPITGEFLVTGALGASGGLMAVLGLLTVLNPDMKIYLYFLIPVPIWAVTGFFAAYDFFYAASFGVGAGGVGRLAHLSGIAIGLLYGWKLKQEGMSVKNRLNPMQGGGRRPPRR